MADGAVDVAASGAADCSVIPIVPPFTITPGASSEASLVWLSMKSCSSCRSLKRPVVLASTGRGRTAVPRLTKINNKIAAVTRKQVVKGFLWLVIAAVPPFILLYLKLLDVAHSQCTEAATPFNSASGKLPVTVSRKLAPFFWACQVIRSAPGG